MSEEQMRMLGNAYAGLLQRTEMCRVLQNPGLTSARREADLLGYSHSEGKACEYPPNTSK